MRCSSLGYIFDRLEEQHLKFILIFRPTIRRHSLVGVRLQWPDDSLPHSPLHRPITATATNIETHSRKLEQFTRIWCGARMLRFQCRYEYDYGVGRLEELRGESARFPIAIMGFATASFRHKGPHGLLTSFWGSPSLHKSAESCNSA